MSTLSLILNFDDNSNSYTNPDPNPILKGNFRAFLTYDLLKRWLEYCGYDVDHVCNLTDIDDKIIAKMSSSGQVGQSYNICFFSLFWYLYLHISLFYA